MHLNYLLDPRRSATYVGLARFRNFEAELSYINSRTEFPERGRLSLPRVFKDGIVDPHVLCLDPAEKIS